MKGMDIHCREVDMNNSDKVIDFNKAKKDGIDFIIPRDGWGTSKTDPKLIEYVKGAKSAGIDVPGVFHFVYAVNLQQAIQNAQRAIQNVELADLPKSTVIWCDIEYDTVDNAKKQGVTLTPKTLKGFAEGFCNFVLAQGYPTGIYLNRDYLVNIYGESIKDEYDIWLADLSDNPKYDCVYWQYDWHGLPSGCRSEVDLDKYIGKYTAGTSKTKGGDKLKASVLLQQIHDVVDNIPTVYHQCENFGGWNSSAQAFNQDCIVWIKSMVYWDWYKPDKNLYHGGMTYKAQYDWTEPQILSHCTNVKYSGFLSAKPCEYLYMSGHGGFKIDEFTRNGRTYNAAECTWADAWGTPAKCVYSYVDDNGGRYNYKGGIRNGTWEAHGELYGVEYDEMIPVEPKTTHELALEVIAGKWGNGQARKDALKAAGYDYATVQAEVERILKEGEKEDKKDFSTIPLETFISYLRTIQKGDTGETVKLLQNCLSKLGYYYDAVDGSAGPNTVKAINDFKEAAGLSPNGVFDTNSWKKLIK